MRTHLPTLQPGITVLDADDRTGPLQSLIIHQLATLGGDAVWVDAANDADTSTLHALAPDPGLLDRIRVARAFTPHQHQALLETLQDQLTDDTALLAVPAIAHRYAAEDLPADRGAAMLDRALTLLRDHSPADLPVLVTPGADRYADTVRAAADTTIRCTQTSHGPRFRGPGFETLLYPDRGGAQTTLAFWRALLADPDRVEARTVMARG